MSTINVLNRSLSTSLPKLLTHHTNGNGHQSLRPITKRHMSTYVIINVINRSMCMSRPNLSTHHSNYQEVGMATNCYAQSQKDNCPRTTLRDKRTFLYKKREMIPKKRTWLFREKKRHTPKQYSKECIDSFVILEE